MSNEFHYNTPKMSLLNELRGKKLLDNVTFNIDDFRGKKVVYFDGSTSIGNCRGIELASTLGLNFQLKDIANEVQVFIVGGGSVSGVFNDLKIGEVKLKNRFEINQEKLSQYKDIFSSVKIDERNFPYLPSDLIYMPRQRMSLREANVRARELLLSRAQETLINNNPSHMPPLSVCAFEDLLGTISGNKLESFMDHFEPNKIIMKFICPDCSKQQKNSIEHGITMDTSGVLNIVKTTGKKVKCKGAKSIRNNWDALKRLDVGSLIKLGFYFSGKMIYFLSTKAFNTDNSAFLIRNYSQDRGTSRVILDYWKGQLGITKRFYFKDKREYRGGDFIRLISRNQELRSYIKKSNPILTEFDDNDYYFPVDSN